MSQRRIPDALLERYLAQDLAAELKAKLEGTLAESPDDRARLQQLRADTEAFLLTHPPKEGLARLPKNPKRLFSFWALWPVWAAASALAAWAIWILTPKPSDLPLYAVKGGLSLSVYLKNGADSERVLPGARLPAGTRLRFEVKATEPGYIALLGKDSSGQVTVYYPADASTPAIFSPQQPLLPIALELDDARGREAFFAVYGKSAFSLAACVEAIKTSGKTPDAVEITSFDIEKP